MSLMDELINDEVWINYLDKKKEKNVINKKELKELEDYILNKKYKDILNVINNDNYILPIPKKVSINKNHTNKKRILYINDEDMNYLLKILTNLLHKYDYLYADNLYSFRENKTVRDAIFKIVNTPLKKRKYAYKVDISNYFNSVNVNELLKTLKEDLKDDKLYNFIKSILLNKKVIFNNDIIEEEKGIMAGTPISSFLANYYLKDLDLYFENNNILYLRYSDDIIVFSESYDELENYIKIIKDTIKAKGLNINKEKEVIYKENEKIDFLGFSIYKKTIDVSENSFRKIKGKIKRTIRGLRRWMIRKNSTPSITLKAMNRKFNYKFYGTDTNEISWKYWYFPVINTTKTLKEIDKYMQEEERYMITGKHNKKNYELIPYSKLKECNYKSLVHEYYKYKSKNML